MQIDYVYFYYDNKIKHERRDFKQFYKIAKQRFLSDYWSLT